MPHKRNPIISERICGQARVIRCNMLAAFENIPLWHERDISHSSVERVILPDSTILLHYMLEKTCWLIDKLMVHPENMAANLEKSYGLIYSQRVLLALVKAGMLRDDAYAVVQRNAMKAWEEKTPFVGAAQGRRRSDQVAQDLRDTGVLRPRAAAAAHERDHEAGGRSEVVGAGCRFAACRPVVTYLSLRADSVRMAITVPATMSTKVTPTITQQGRAVEDPADAAADYGRDEQAHG